MRMRIYALLLTIFLILVVVNSALDDSEVQGDLNTGKDGKVLDTANDTNRGNDKKTVTPEETKVNNQSGSGSKEGADGSKDSLAGNDSGKTNTSGTGNDSGNKEKVGSEGADKQLGSKGTGNDDEKVVDKDGDKKNKGNDSKETGNGETGDTGSELKKTDGKESGQMVTNDKGDEKDGKTKDKASGGSSSESKDGTLVQGRKESGEACDSFSNSCSIEEKSIVACLRVPGNESPDLSLLIQNKGKGPVTLTISAPEFVKLQQKQIQVKENDNEKVMVTVGNEESDDSKIVLKSGNGNCVLDFKGMIAHSYSKRDPGFMAQLSYINLVKHSSSYVWFILLAAILVIASVWMGISFRRKYAATRNGSKYQKLEMELPVSSGVSKSSAPLPSSNDGWEDNWDDDWDDDDEEVAMPASSPVTPSLSSNGIAPRRIVKDGWKD